MRRYNNDGCPTLSRFRCVYEGRTNVWSLCKKFGHTLTYRVNETFTVVSASGSQNTSGVRKVLLLHFDIVKRLQDQANKFFKDVLDTKALKGKNSEAIAASCLYIACRKEQVPRTFKGKLPEFSIPPPPPVV